MKKKLIALTLLLFMICIISDLHIKTAKAAEIPGTTTDGTTGGTDDGTAVETRVVNSIAIMQYPSKQTYSKGESLELSDMVVQGYYADGTSEAISNYEVIGYDSNLVGTQTVIVVYQNQMAAFTVNVIPAKVTNVTVSNHYTDAITLTWDTAPGTTRYEVYALDDLTGNYVLIAYTDTNNTTMFYPPGTVHSYKICAVETMLGIEYRGDYSDVCIAATNPEAVAGLNVTGTTTSTISLSWTMANGASGYVIYRSSAASNDYVLCGTSVTTDYTDTGLKSGQSYKYKVCAYAYSETFPGDYSPIADISTNPSKVSLKYKVGEQKIRFTWAKVTGATSYDIYAGDSVNGYIVLTTSTGNSGGTYTAEGLVTGNTYTFYAIAHRSYNGVIYDSPATDQITITMAPIEKTSTAAKLFATKKDFTGSWTYKSLPFFSKYVNYTKSFIIPGLVTTNVAGFSSNTMCPQGITFAENYFLVSAYDLSGQENSVIYVMDKSSKKLLTTLVLPSKPHAGGICYDGFNIWVTNGSKVSSILFSEVDAAAKSGQPYVPVSFNTVNTLNITTSYITYYNNKLWVGTYNELQATNLYSYIIDNKDTKPVLTKADTILMPTRVQGIAFSKIGTMILSRSCQLYKGLRGYMRQLDSYKPDFANAVNGSISLGNLVNSVSMPSMNEGIAIDGSYLYVNFESGAFDASTYKMDRICAFKLVDVVKKTDK